MWRSVGSHRRVGVISKAFSKKFRRDVVRVTQQSESGVSIAQVAADFGVSADCLQRWLDEENKMFSPAGRKRIAESSEFREARRRIRMLEQENEVLRRAAACLSRANLPGK